MKLNLGAVLVKEYSKTVVKEEPGTKSPVPLISAENAN